MASWTGRFFSMQPLSRLPSSPGERRSPSYSCSKVEVLSEYEREIKSVSSSVKLPAVVRLLRFVRNHRNGLRFSRRNLLLRDDHTCQYCGKRFDPKFLTCDHIIPRSRGGTTEWTNIVTSCIFCNLKKGDKLPEEGDMYPRKRPGKPDSFYILRLNMGVKVLPEPWKAYTFIWRVR